MQGDSEEEDELPEGSASASSFLAGPELLPNLHIDDSELPTQDVSR